MARLVAQVAAVYPGEFRGGEIAAPLFFLLARQLPAVLAMQRVTQADAVAKGAGLVMNGEKMLPLLKADREEAFGDGAQ